MLPRIRLRNRPGDRYAPAVGLNLRVERIDARYPARGPKNAVLPTLSRLAVGRPLVVVDVYAGREAGSPGTRVSPWCITAVEQAAADASLSVEVARIAARAPGRETGPKPRQADLGPRITLEVPGCAARRSVPRSWIGAHLCLAVPSLCLEVSGSKRPRGPVASALAALDAACHRRTQSGQPDVGAALTSAVFASTTVVIDASWWAPMQLGDGAPPELTPLGYCVTAGVSAPQRDWSEGLHRRVDGRLTSARPRESRDQDIRRAVLGGSRR